MKKVYFSLLSLFFVTALSAQYDIEVSLDNPASGATGVTASTNFEIDFTMTNNGPNDVPSGDTIFVAIVIPGVSNYSLNNGAQGSVSIIPLSQPMPSGTSISTVDLGGAAVIDLQNKISGPTDVCIYATIGENAFTTGTDPNDSDMGNNQDCFNADNDYTSTEEVAEVTPVYNVYPNPANSEVTVEISTPDAVENITFYNAMGQKVVTQVVNSGNTTVDISALAEGIYTYQVIGNNGQVLEVNRLSVVK